MSRLVLLALSGILIVAAGCSQSAETTAEPTKQVAPPVNETKGAPEASASGTKELSLNPNANIEQPGSKLKSGN